MAAQRVTRMLSLALFALLLLHSVSKMAAATDYESQVDTEPSCPVVLTSVRMEVAPLLLYAICQDNSSVALRLTCGEDVWFERVTGFCNSFDLNIGRVSMNHPLKSSRTFLDLVKTGRVLDNARVVILASDHLNRYRISVWGQRNTRFILGIVRMCEGVEYDDHLAGKAGIFHQDDASWSYKSEELYDNYDSQLYDAYSDSEQPVKKEIPWPVISTHQSPLMDMTQSRRSFYDSESGVPNTPRAYYEGLETDKLLQSLTPATESVMGDYFDQHLPGNEEKWESYTGQKSSMFNPMEPVSTLPTKEAAKRDILPNPFLYNANSRSVDQPTMSTPTRPIDDKSRDNYPVESSPEDHELEHQLSYSPDATDSEVHNLPKIFRRIKYAGERKPAVADDDRGKPVVISNRNSTSKESLILHKDSRKHNISILDFVFTTIKPSRVRESTRIDMINSEASSLEHRITSRPSQTTGEHLPSEARSLSLSSSDSSKSFKPSFNVSRKQTTLLPSFTNSESDKTSMQFYSSAFRIPDSSQLINFTARSKQSEGESVTLVTTNTTPILTHFLATKNLNHTIKEDLDSVKSSVGVTSFSLGVSDVMVASLPYGFQVSEPFRYPGGFRASETSSRPQGDPPVGFLASEPFYYKGDDQATTTPAGSEPDGFLVSEPFKYTFDNEPTLASSISLHPTVRDFPNDFTLETFHLTQNSQPTLEVGLGPTLASVFTRPSARPNEDVLGNFLQSEPFHFVLREKSADIARTSQSRTPVLSSASLTLQPSHSKSDSLTTTAFMSTSHSEHLVSSSSVLGSSADARILPTARYSHVQPTSAWMSTTAIAGIGANSSDGGGYTESQNEGAERDTVWPVVAALVVGIPSVIVFGIAITVFHRRRTPDPQKLFNMQTLRSAQMDTSDSDMTNNIETPIRTAIS